MANLTLGYLSRVHLIPLHRMDASIDFKNCKIPEFNMPNNMAGHRSPQEQLSSSLYAAIAPHVEQTCDMLQKVYAAQKQLEEKLEAMNDRR